MQKIKDSLVEHETIKGFFRHPWLLHIFVSKDGLVYSETERWYVKQRLYGGYYSILSLDRAVHLLVLDTFLDVPEHLKNSRVVGNHLNGITICNNLSNLEWTSYSGNSEHAYRTGLRPDNIPVLIKDLRSGEIVRHYSLWEAGRAHSVNGACIHWFLKPENTGKVFRKFFLVIGEGAAWPEVDQSAMNPKGPGYERQVYVEDYKLNVRIVFPTLVQAAEHLEMKMHTLYARLRKSISKGLIGHVESNFGVWYLDTFTKELPADVQAAPERPKKMRSARPVRHPVPIIVTDLATGEKETVASSEVFARRLGVKKNTFQRYIYFNDGIWKGKFHVHYCE